MLKEPRRRAIDRAKANVERAQTTLDNAQVKLTAELLDASAEGASYADLGEVLGVSRQRVGQIITSARARESVTTQ